MLREFYEKNLKSAGNFDLFLFSFLEKILPPNINLLEYKESAIQYLFYDDDEFLYKLKYSTFRQVDSEFLEKIFDSFINKNSKWVNFLWNNCKDKEKTQSILTKLGDKKIEVIKTITMPSFKSLEMDVKNSEIVTNILNSIVNNVQELQKQQSTMFANVSHEMRTPLNSVIGYLDILDSMQTLTIEERKYVSYAKNSSKILLTLINDLLDTQKLNNSKLDLINNPFWISKIIKSAVLISSINATQKNIEFIYNDKINVLREVKGDKNRFLQILNNILSNAVKFTPEHGKIEMTAASVKIDDKIKVHIEIKDNGIGIPKDKQKDLFKPFSRATNKEKGTGLGLYISRQLARRMGGDIWFESEEGKGTTFFIEVVFEISNNFYNQELLKNRKIVIFETQQKDIYTDDVQKQLLLTGAKIKAFKEIDKFLNFLMFNSDIDIVIIIYPNKIEDDDLDISFIKTYKNLHKNSDLKTHFIAGIKDNFYPKNNFIYDKIISLPITMLDILEILSTNSVITNSYKYLIIDDEPMNRMVLSTMIKTFDKEADIDVAVNGIEGLEKLKNDKYDIVFLDKRMPKMDGYGVLENLDRLGIKANIYLLTADGDNETIQKAKEYNVGYIAKPVTLNTLKSIMSKLKAGRKNAKSI